MFLLLLSHLFNSITFILYCVFIIDVVNAEYIDAGVVMFIVALNCSIGFFQEFKSERSLASLQKLAVGMTTVLRDGGTMNIPITDVVVGDVVLLKGGDVIPADGRVAQSTNLEVDEALLTGESMTIFKHIEALPMPQVQDGLDVRLAVGDRSNMVFRQSIVVSGTGICIVCAVGRDTKVGQLASMLQGNSNEQTPMQKRLERFMFALFGVAIALALLIFLITMSVASEIVVYAAATGIALLPEALIVRIIDDIT
jgi:magnesium-transporting ATPase (P-type)